MPRRDAHGRQVARLYQQRRSLTAALGNLERRAEVYRATIVEVEAELRSIGVEPRLLVTRAPLLPGKARDFRWVVLRHLRAANAPINSADLARRIIADIGLDGAEVFAKTRQRVRHSLDALAGMGLAQVEEDRPTRKGGALWEAES